MAAERTREEKLFAAAVLLLSDQLRADASPPGMRTVYLGVLRDLGLESEEVEAWLEAHRDRVESVLGRGGRSA